MEEIALAEGALQDSKIALKKAEEQVSFTPSTTVSPLRHHGYFTGTKND